MLTWLERCDGWSVSRVVGDPACQLLMEACPVQVPSIPWSGSFGGENDGPLTAELDEEVRPACVLGIF
ncbi:MAG: hypothetical protein ACPIOQ_12280 [Promethearchaeia archaeon]